MGEIDDDLKSLLADDLNLFEEMKGKYVSENERKYSIPVLLTIYTLFIVGVLMSYYILFPVSFRFLGTYSVAEQVHSTITLDSYISTFVTLTLVMGVDRWSAHYQWYRSNGGLG